VNVPLQSGIGIKLRMKKIAIITGASKGIGKVTASLFIENDWQVINIARHACDLNSITNFKIDLADVDWEQKNQNAFQILQDAEQICLVHNACAYEKGTVANLNSETFRSVLEVNLVA